MRKLMKDYFVNYHNKRFKNCCVLLLKYDAISRNTIANILYEGEIDEKEKRDKSKYYTKNDFNSENLYSTKLIIPENINIFIIRHAQGYHNLNHSFLKKLVKNTKVLLNLSEENQMKDPQLTDDGINQATKCGIFLNDYIKSNELDINNFLCFCSILYRTRQTIKYILSNCNLNITDIYVLPCNHELSTIYNEKENINYGRCKYTSEQEIYECKHITNINKININWNYYIYFKENMNMCFDTNIIYETYLCFAYLIDRDLYNVFFKKLKT
jgi:hypothetical protein